MKKNLFIILILLPNLCLALSKEEINAIAEIVNCSDKITSEEKLKCFEENASNLESIFPIVRLEKTERVKEIEKIERLEKEGNFGILQTVNPIKGFENKDYSYELAPFTGSAPHYTVSPDSSYDIEDLMAFGMTWNWQSSQNRSLFRQW